MKKNVLKNICFIMFLFFSFIGNVNANFFDLAKGQHNIYAKCDYTSGCMAICVYNTDLGNTGNEVGLVGYYQGDGDKWVIAFRGDESHNSGLYDLYYSINDEKLVHGDDIYEGNHHERKDWFNSDMYNDLRNNFNCPSRMYIDKGLADYNELCFENNDGNCTGFNRPTTSFVPAYLSYSFATEYTSVMDAAYEELTNKFTDDNEELNKQKVKFLSTLLPGQFQYLDSHSADENAALNCNYLQEKADEKYAKFLKEIAEDKDVVNRYLNNYVNPTISSIAQEKHVKYPNLYNYITLTNLIGSKDIGPHPQQGATIVEKESLLDKFSKTAYNRNVKESISFISNYCNDKGAVKIDMRVDTDGDGVIDSDNMNDIINSERVSFDIRKFTDPKIIGLENPDSLTYDCGFLSDIADIISTAYFVIEMIGLAILVIFTSMDYIKIFLNDNADELKKANSNFIKRLIIAVVLFLLPALVNFALRLFKIEGVNSEHPLCVQISNK